MKVGDVSRMGPHGVSALEPGQVDIGLEIPNMVPRMKSLSFSFLSELGDNSWVVFSKVNDQVEGCMARPIFKAQMMSVSCHLVYPGSSQVVLFLHQKQQGNSRERAENCPSAQWLSLMVHCE